MPYLLQKNVFQAQNRKIFRLCAIVLFVFDDLLQSGIDLGSESIGDSQFFIVFFIKIEAVETVTEVFDIDFIAETFNLTSQIIDRTETAGTATEEDIAVFVEDGEFFTAELFVQLACQSREVLIVNTGSGISGGTVSIEHHPAAAVGNYVAAIKFDELVTVGIADERVAGSNILCIERPLASVIGTDHGAFGIEIIDGKLTDNYVSPVVMSGYVPDLLKSISMISDEFEVIGSGSCGKGYKEWVRVADGGPALKVKVKLA